jgi:hypothetical protein
LAPGNEGINMPMPTRIQADPIIEGLKRAKVKPLNYSQVTVIQGPEENTIRKHTIVDPESQVGEVLLKDKFLTQSAPDIHRKLQKSVAEGEKSLDQLIQVAMSIYYNQDLTKKREKDKKHHALIRALRECSTRQGPTSQACYHCGQEGHFHRECPKGGVSRWKEGWHLL